MDAADIVAFGTKMLYKKIDIDHGWIIRGVECSRRLCMQWQGKGTRSRG